MDSIKELWRLPVDGLTRRLLCGAVSIFLAAVAAVFIQQQYQIATNPRIAGQLEKTWVIVRGRHNQHVRVADLTFTVTQAGRPVVCHAEAIDIGNEAFAAKAGDSIELSPIPGTCKKPYVMNVQMPTWGFWALIGVIVGTSVVFALFASSMTLFPVVELGRSNF